MKISSSTGIRPPGPITVRQTTEYVPTPVQTLVKEMHMRLRDQEDSSPCDPPSPLLTVPGRLARSKRSRPADPVMLDALVTQRHPFCPQPNPKLVDACRRSDNMLQTKDPDYRLSMKGNAHKPGSVDEFSGSFHHHLPPKLPYATQIRARMVDIQGVSS